MRNIKRFGFSGFCFDLESDNFYLETKNVWYIRLTDFFDEGKTISIKPFEEGVESSKKKFMDFVKQYNVPTVVAHNGIGFDLWVIWKMLDIVPEIGKKGKDFLNGIEVNFIDTYVLSMFLSPDRSDGHSLDALTRKNGSHKIDYRGELIKAGFLTDSSPKGEEFKHWFEGYTDVYCDQDVAGNIVVFDALLNESNSIYNKYEIHPSFRMLQKDYWLYSAQAYTGVCFDKEYGFKLIENISKEMEEIEKDVLPKLPLRPLKKGEQKNYTIPAKPFKKDGTLSSTMIKWVEKHSGKILPDGRNFVIDGMVYEIEGGKELEIKVPMEIKDGEELKDWFQNNGWVPTMFNFKRDPLTGKPMRDGNGNVITTTPKIQEQGRICPNLLELGGDIPRQVVKFLSLRNRRSVLTSWVNNPRLDFDGRLSGTITGYTPTFRVKHSNVVNVPKASKDVLYGPEFRALFKTEGTNVFIGTDAAALENRTVAHYTTRYDGGEYAKLILEGDSHSRNAKIFFPKETEKFDINDPSFNKDDPEFKTFRNKAKTGVYSLTYGASEKKFGGSLGLSGSESKRAYEGFWDNNPGLKAFKENIEKYWENTGKKKYIPAIDGRMLCVRSKHLLINLAGQSCGAIAMSMAMCLMDSFLGKMHIDEKGRPYYLYKGKEVKRVLAFHDEYSWECHPDVAEDISKKTVECIVKAGEFLKMRVALDGEGKIGKTWCDVH